MITVSDAYIVAKQTPIFPNTGKAAAPNNRNKKVILKNCAPFTNCISEINNPYVDDPHDIDIVMSMYNLIEYSDIYLKTSRCLWQYYGAEPNFLLIAIIVSLKFKEKITRQTGEMRKKMLK